MPTCYECMYMNHNDSNNSLLFTKYYCSEMKRYLSSETPACGKFVQRTERGCYLTTACVQYKGLPDDCYELSTLRAFRDTYIAKIDGGEALIQKYYETAPLIIEKINESPLKDEIYNLTYDYILSCVDQIENKNYEKALHLYKNMIDEFTKKFL